MSSQAAAALAARSAVRSVKSAEVRGEQTCTTVPPSSLATERPGCTSPAATMLPKYEGTLRTSTAASSRSDRTASWL